MGKGSELKTIGRLVEDLKAEFSNISVSKVRYLEEEGLVKPARSRGGYRRFNPEDESRIREILRLQTQHYLPLHVIRERLALGGRPSGSHPQEAGAPAGRRPQAEGSLFDHLFGAPAENGELVPWEAAARQSGLNPQDLDDLERYGLVRSVEDTQGKALPAGDAEIARLARDLKRYGLEPRHLRAFASHAERQAALFSQILGPLLRKGREGRPRAHQAARELEALSNRLGNLLITRELRKRFSV